MHPKPKSLALLALAAAGVVGGWAIYSSTGGQSGARKTNATPSAPTAQRVVLTWLRTGERTRIRGTCGSIHARGKFLAVDIADGRLPVTCVAARAVMTRFLGRPVAGYGTVRYGRRTFACYKSRPDGVGWDYNCNFSKYTAADAYVDVGAGRRPYR